MNGERFNRIASLMTSFRQGDRAAAGELIEILHPELRRLAAAKMKGERTDHTWQPTVLVNELYLELLKIKALRPAQPTETDEKAAFLYLAAHLMKRLLARHAQPLSRHIQKIELPENTRLLETAEDTAREVDDVLCRLGSIKPQLRTVVEMKIFEGMTVEEIAGQLGCAPITVNRYWNVARHWLREEFAGAR